MTVRVARSDWRAEVCATLDALESELDDLVVRGLSACNNDDVRALVACSADLSGAGAAHVAGRIDDVVNRQRAADKGAARALLQLMTSLRVFERVLTLEAVADLFAGDAAETAEATTKPKPTFTPLPPGEEKKLLPVLDDLCKAVEDLVASGLVTASASTKQKLEVSFKEASRLKLGRLAASLRYVTEEIQRYLDGAKTFSPRRLALFLNRSWVLGRGLSQALLEKNEAALARLLLSWPAVTVDSAVVACVGIRKRVPQGTGIVAFDFHFRLVEAVGPLPAGAALIWSHIVPRKESKVMAEALLHLELKPQGLKPIDLAVAHHFAFDTVNIVVDANGGGRLMLTPDTRVRDLGAFDGWAGLVTFDRRCLLERVEQHDVSPLDLEVELAVEVAFDDVTVADKGERGDLDVQHLVVQMPPRGDADDGDDDDGDDDDADDDDGDDGGELAVGVEVVLARSEESKELTLALGKMQKKKPTSPMFGVLHFDRCRLMFQPLSLLTERGPQHLMLNLDKIDLKELTRTLF